MTDIDRTLKQDKRNIKMNCFFYYMIRNYDYIENIYTYNNHEELVRAVNNTKEKWLILVYKLPSQNTEDPLNNISRKVVELSRHEIDSTKSARKLYNYIIENECFKEDVLITLHY